MLVAVLRGVADKEWHAGSPASCGALWHRCHGCTVASTDTSWGSTDAGLARLIYTLVAPATAMDYWSSDAWASDRHAAPFFFFHFLSLQSPNIVAVRERT